MFGRLGFSIIMTLRESGRALLMLGEAFLFLPQMGKKRSRWDVIFQMYLGGIKTLGVVTVVALFTGMILALQTGLELRDFGQEYRIGWLVMEVMLREMGPMMTGIILAASVGSAIAAQLGTMTVSEEISALEIMSINPVRYLVAPRLLALMVIVPLVTVYTNCIGVCGGALVGYTQLDVAFQTYFDQGFRYAQAKGLYVGLFKAWLFGIIITTVACHQGFSVKGGAVGVGNATRRTVIISFLSILVVGYIVTSLFYQ